jgi:hypothetical protein
MEHPVTTPREFHIMGNKNGGEPVGTMQTFQQFENHLAGPEIQVPCGFVGQ